jgi:hypothetical protein
MFPGQFDDAHARLGADRITAVRKRHKTLAKG